MQRREEMPERAAIGGGEADTNALFSPDRGRPRVPHSGAARGDGRPVCAAPAGVFRQGGPRQRCAPDVAGLAARWLLTGLLVLVVATAKPSPGAARPLARPNDPLFESYQAYLLDVNAPAAWDIQTGDPGVVVAILDSGVDVSHPDLVANIWTNPRPGEAGCNSDLHGCNFVDPSQGSSRCGPGAPLRGGDVSPTTAHGTLAAGIVGAAGNNGIGVAGVAWRVSLLPVRMADCRGRATTPAVVAAIRYAADNGARVILVEVSTARTTPIACRPPDITLADAVQYARDRGALVVAPAGDDNRPCVGDPAAAPGALAVGGYQGADRTRWGAQRLTPAANWGPQIALVAPAQAITGTIPFKQGVRPPNDWYGKDDGTSLAAAIVAGAAALLLSQNPLLTPDWLTELLMLGAYRLPDGDAPGWSGAGAVDLAASLRLVPAAYGGSLAIGGTPAPDGTLVEGYVAEVRCAQAASFSTAGISSYALYVPVATMQSGCGRPGSLVDLRVNGVSAARVPWAAVASQVDLDTDPGPAQAP